MLDHLARLEGIHKPDESINTFKVVQVSTNKKASIFEKEAGGIGDFSLNISRN